MYIYGLFALICFLSKCFAHVIRRDQLITPEKKCRAYMEEGELPVVGVSTIYDDATNGGADMAECFSKNKVCMLL